MTLLCKHPLNNETHPGLKLEKSSKEDKWGVGDSGGNLTAFLVVVHYIVFNCIKNYYSFYNGF